MSDFIDELRVRADQDSAEAQLNLALSYLNGRGAPQDYLLAHMWANLSASHARRDLWDRSVEVRDQAAKHLSPSQILEAQKLARESRPNTIRDWTSEMVARGIARAGSSPAGRAIVEPDKDR